MDQSTRPVQIVNPSDPFEDIEAERHNGGLHALLLVFGDEPTLDQAMGDGPLYTSSVYEFNGQRFVAYSWWGSPIPLIPYAPGLTLRSGWLPRGARCVYDDPMGIQEIEDPDFFGPILKWFDREPIDDRVYGDDRIKLLRVEKELWTLLKEPPEKIRERLIETNEKLCCPPLNLNERK